MVAIISIMDRGQQLATRVVDRDFIVHCARDVNKATRLVERNAERKETYVGDQLLAWPVLTRCVEDLQRAILVGAVKVPHSIKGCSVAGCRKRACRPGETGEQGVKCRFGRGTIVAEEDKFAET